MNKRISAVICTRNRATCLNKAIQSLVDQTLPQEQYEIIVVDNGSTDNTKAIIEGFEHFENLRYIYEPVLGLSQARNTGWQNACGKYVAYIDDDAIACPEWLERWGQTFDNVQPQPGSVGGKVIPVWEVERPTWLPKQGEDALAVVDWGDQSKFLIEEHEHHVGCNVAYPREILQGCGGFNTNLGRKGTNLLSNDENLVRSYIRQHNLGIYYDPEACVEHHIPGQRLVKRFFYRRAFWQGISHEVLQYLETGQRESKWRYVRRAIMNTLSFVRWLIVFLVFLPLLIRPANRANRFETKCGLCWWLGRIWGQLQIGLGRIKE